MNTLLDAGAGVFAKCSIQKGAFLFHYEGEWRKKSVMDNLEKVLEKRGVEGSYYVEIKKGW